MSRVVRFSREGQQEATFHDGQPGVRPLEQPTDVALTPDGTVYAVDLLGRVVRIGSDSLIDREWTVSVGLERGGSHLAVWGNLIAITNPDSNGLTFLDPASGVVRVPRLANSAHLDLNKPIGVATTLDGRLLVLNSGDNSLLVLDRAP
jgi:DNA-binding beta-propeller fold protein YncE